MVHILVVLVCVEHPPLWHIIRVRRGANGRAGCGGRAGSGATGRAGCGRGVICTCDSNRYKSSNSFCRDALLRSLGAGSGCRQEGQVMTRPQGVMGILVRHTSAQSWHMTWSTIEPQLTTYKSSECSKQTMQSISYSIE
jgi:hypothetical protein